MISNHHTTELHTGSTKVVHSEPCSNTKKKERQNTHRYPSDLPRTLSHSLHDTNFSAVSLTCYNSKITVQNLCTASARPDITDRHPSTSQINFSSFYFTENTPTTQASRLCHHLIYPTVPKSEARTCRLLIATEGNTSNLTLPKSHQAPAYLFHTHDFLPKKSAPILPT